MSFEPFPSMSARTSSRATGPGNVNVGFAGMPDGVCTNTSYTQPRSSIATRSERPSPFRSPTAIGPAPGALRVRSYVVHVGNADAGPGAAERTRAITARTMAGARTRRARRILGGPPSTLGPGATSHGVALV